MKSEIEYEIREAKALKKSACAVLTMNLSSDRSAGVWCLIVAISMAIFDTSDAHALRTFQTRPPPAKYGFNRKALQSPPGKGKIANYIEVRLFWGEHKYSVRSEIGLLMISERALYSENFPTPRKCKFCEMTTQFTFSRSANSCTARGQ